MLDHANSKPAVCIFGTGEYYQKLRTGLKKEFKVLGKFSESGPEVVRRIESLTPDAILVLSPNATHLPILSSVIHMKVPVLVEKPAVVNREELYYLDKVVKENPLIYFSDFYVDVRALPLLAITNQIPLYHEKLKGALQSSGNWESVRSLGQQPLREIRQITGKILEGRGKAARMEHRSWLREASSGGVILDLLCHLLVVVARLFPSQPIDVKQVIAGRHRHGTPAGRWELLRTLGQQAETYCRISGSIGLQAYFCLEVGKYWLCDDRKLTLDGPEAEFSLEFSKTNSLRWKCGGREGTTILEDNYYQLVSKAFRYYIESGVRRPHNYEETRKVLEILFTCREKYTALPPGHSSTSPYELPR